MFNQSQSFIRKMARAAASIAMAATLAFNVQAKSIEDAELNRIVIKFKEGSGLEVGNAGLASPASPNASSAAAAVSAIARNNNLPLKSIFGKANQLSAPGLGQGNSKLAQAAAELDRYFFMPLDKSWKYKKAEKVLEKLKALDLVEEAYIEPVPELASIITTTDISANDVIAAPGAETSDTPDYEFRQGYLAEAPSGIDAYHAWNIPGGRGEGVKIVDIEFAMDTNHEDLPDLFFASGIDETSYRDHGTAVMGVIGSVNNGFGTTGIAHNAQIGFASHQVAGMAEAIRDAADAVGRGGVIILEVHYSSSVSVNCSCNSSQCGFVPAEFLSANYSAIRYAVEMGVIVIQAAGNGSANLDDPRYVSAYNMEGREDSGAITVGGSYDDVRGPKCWSNHGSLVDVHGWGEYVTTTGYGYLYNGGQSPEGFNRTYTSSFSGTSSASPVVAGAAASLQGVALAENGDFLSPAEIEEILVNTGTPQTQELNKPIGSLPNLRSATNYVLGIPPVTNYDNVYFRGTASGWDPLPMTPLYDHVWEVEVTFDGTPNPRFKFDIFGDWTENYGDDEGDFVADLAGEDIVVDPNATYRITFHELTRSYTVTEIVPAAVEAITLDWSSSAYQDVDFVQVGANTWQAEFEGTQTWERFFINITQDGSTTAYYDEGLDGVLDVSVFPEQAFEDTVQGTSYVMTINDQTLAYTLEAVTDNTWQRTLVFIYGETQPGQDMFVRGGIDHGYAQNSLGRNCTSENYECAIPIRHLNLRNNTTAPWKSGDNYLDWYGTEAAQSSESEGSALDWTTDFWPAEWGTKKTYEVDGSGETPLNTYGQHYWLLEVEMDCSATADGWFELKSYISNGPGWEGDVAQPGAPWVSGNHFAECGKKNVFRRGESNPVTIEDL